MSMATVAEGIETAAQAASMRALGCTYGQGFFFSMPLLSDDLVAAFAREGRSGEPAASADAKPARTRRLGIARTSPTG
jgi:sensor c-di-GMP phosphodiesterase-like protein